MSPEPSASVSRSGQYVVRILPSSGDKPARAVIFEFEPDGNRYVKKREFILVNRRSPVESCISDSAEVVTFDDWGMMGYEHVVVWYSPEGTKRGEYTLSQLFPAKQLAELREKHSTVSSIHWRRGAPFFNGAYLIIPDPLGGLVSLSNGVLEYTPPEKK